MEEDPSRELGDGMAFSKEMIERSIGFLEGSGGRIRLPPGVGLPYAPPVGKREMMMRDRRH